MGEKNTSLTVNLLGREYRIRSDRPAQEVELILAGLEERLEAVNSRYPRLGPLQTLVLVVLELAEENYDVSKELSDLWEMVGGRPKEGEG